MKIYYTNASKFDVEQNNPQKSIGGFKSSTTLFNGRVDNLFPLLSNRALNMPDSREVRAIMLKNDSVSTLNSIKFWIDTPINNICLFQASIGAMNQNTPANQYMELLASGKDLPFNATFVNATATYAEGDLTILTPASFGDILVVLGVSTTISTVAPTIEQCVDEIIASFVLDTLNTATKVGTDTIHFTRKLIGNVTDVIDMTGGGTATTSNYSGGTDNSISIPSMITDNIQALWIKRTINPDYVKPTCSDLFSQTTPETLQESVSLNFEWI